MQCILYFRILLGIPSYPVEFFGLRDIITVFIPASQIGIVSFLLYYQA